MGTPGTLAKAGLLLCCGVGKIAMGFFAQPLDWDHFGILACAWGEWGEFSFLIAAAARRHHGKGLLRDETYNAICLAVLISMVVLSKMVFTRSIFLFCAQSHAIDLGRGGGASQAPAIGRPPMGAAAAPVTSDGFQEPREVVFESATGGGRGQLISEGPPGGSKPNVWGV